MKYLKNQIQFESWRDRHLDGRYTEIKTDIRDICLDLIEDGKIEFDILPGDIASDRYKPCDFMIGFFDKDRNWNGFHITRIIEYLMRIKDYLGNLYGGCGVVFIGERNRVDIDLSDEQRVIGELYGHMISNIAIFVKPLLNESASYSMLRKYSDSVLQKSEYAIGEIKDILLELEDLGFDISVNYSPFTLAGRENDPKIVIDIWGKSKLFDDNADLFSETTSRIKDFVKGLGYATGEGTREHSDYSGQVEYEDDEDGLIIPVTYKNYQLLIQ